MGFRVRAAALLGVLSFVVYCPPAHAGVAVGSEITVREGDVWTKVKVIAVEGHKVQVRYDDGTEEWVGPDRLRPADGSPTAPEAPADSSAPAKPVVRAFSVDQAVELKRMGHWVPAHVRQLGQGWILVAEDNDRKEMRWAEPWALRVPGAAYELEGWGTNSWVAQPGQVQPQKQPRRAPGHSGDPFVVVPESERPITLDDLHAKFEVLSLDNMHPPVSMTPPATAPTTQPAPVYGEFAAWALRGTDNNFSDIFPCTDGSTIAAAAFTGGFGKPTVIIRTRLTSHTRMDLRSLGVPDVKVIAAERDGDRLLSVYDGDKRLQVWEWTDRAYKLTANLQIDPNDRSAISQASFVSPERVVVQAKDWTAPYQTIYLIDLAHKQVISTVRAAKDARLFVHPSGQVVGVMTSSCTALLLRASDFAVIAEYPDAGLASNVSVDATGQWAAYLTTSGVVRIVKIADGSKLGTVAVGAAFKGQLDLVDDKFLLVNHSTVYSVESGIPIWTYNMPPNTRVKPLANGQFLIAADGNKMASVAVASIPDQVGRTALKTASPDRYMLKPGTPVKIDADYSRFGEDKEKAAAAVEGIVRAAGMVVSDKDADFHLTVRVASGPSEKRDYAPGMFAHTPNRVITTVNVPSTILTATLNCKGQPCWKQEIRFMAGGSLSHDAQHSFQDSANAAAQPNAAALKGLSFPSYLPTGAKPGEPAALGASTLQSRRFVPEQPAAPARPPRQH
jgi:hypothetical protein